MTLRFRFSLRLLFLAVTCVCLGLGWVVDRYVRRAYALESLLKFDPKPLLNLTSHNRDKFMRRMAIAMIGGDDHPARAVALSNDLNSATAVGSREAALLMYFPELQQLEFPVGNITDKDLRRFRGLQSLRILNIGPAWSGSSEISDAGLRCLRNMKDLEELVLWETKIQGTGFRSLTALTKLRLIRLSGSRIDDEGAAAIASLPAVQELYLSNAKITDRGVRDLANLAGLECLDLSGTAVTDRGIRELIKCSRLRWLYLSHTNLTQRSAEHLGQMPALREAWIPTSISRSACDQLEQRKPGIKLEFPSGPREIAQ